MLNSKLGLKHTPSIKANTVSKHNNVSSDNGSSTSHVIAKYDYQSQGPQELSITKGERLSLVDDAKHWWKVINANGQTGFVPSNYVKKEKQSLFDSIKRGIRANTRKKLSNSDSSPSSSSLLLTKQDSNTANPTTIAPPSQQQPQSNSDLLEKELGPIFNIMNTSNTLHNNNNDNSNNSQVNDSSNNHNVKVDMNNTSSSSKMPHKSNQQESSGVSVEACKSYARVRYNYKAQQTDELSLAKGTSIRVLEKSSDGWWKGEISGAIGWFPSNYVVENSAQQGLPTSLNSKGSSNCPNTAYNATSSIAKDTKASSDLLSDLVPTTVTNVSNNSGQAASSSNVLYVIVALYSFQSQNNEELSFEKDEYLDIIGEPLNDPDWWQACNQLGEIGLVPKNYVEIVPGMKSIRNWSSDSPTKQQGESNRFDNFSSDNNDAGNSRGSDSYLTGPSSDVPNDQAVSSLAKHLEIALKLREKIWYHGQMSRVQCDQLLNAYAIDGDFLIRNSETSAGDFSVSLKAPVRNKHFRVHYADGAFCIGQRKFSSLDDLIEHYKRTPIYTSPTGDRMYLKKPYPKS